MFNISVYDNAGNKGDSDFISSVIQIDTVPPSSPTLYSFTHPDQNKWYGNNTPFFWWTVPSDASGIAGYSYLINQDQSTTPDNTIDGTNFYCTYNTPITDGTYYFHIKARDNAGNWSSTSNYKINVDTMKPTFQFISPNTVTAGNAFLLGTITVTTAHGGIDTSYTGTRTLIYHGPGSPANTDPSYTNPVCFKQGISTTLLQTTLTKAETVQLYITDGTITSMSTPIIVNHATPERLDITPAIATIDDGDSISYTSTAMDIMGNAWIVTGSTTFTATDPCGTITGSTYIAGKVGTWTITGEHDGLFAFATVTVVHGMATTLTITPATATINAGNGMSYMSTAMDIMGNTWTVTGSTTFTTVDPCGTVTHGLYIAGKVGTWTVSGIYDTVGTTATVVVIHGTATILNITPATATINAGEGMSYTTTATDMKGNTWTVTGSTTFTTIDPCGTVTHGLYIAGKVGTWTITGVYAGKTATATIVVLHSTVERLDITPATATVQSGQQATYTATAKDNQGNTWTVTGSSTFGMNDPKGNMTTYGTYTAGKAGTWTITGVYAGKTATATIVVLHSTVERLDITPATATVQSGQQATYTATAKDSQGNTWIVTGSSTFGMNDPKGSMTTYGTYTAGKAGTWTITGVYAGKTATATIVVLHSTAERLDITPATATVQSGQQATYTATAKDNQGNTWTVTTDTMFGTEDPWGTITGNEYIAGKVGTWIITGTHTATGLVGTSTIVVTPGMAARLEIKPVSSNRWFKNEPGTITISARDKNGNLVATTTTFKLESEGIITPNKATLIKGIATITVSISMAGPVVIIASKGNISGSISLIFVTRKENPNIGTFTTGNGLETRVVIPGNTIAADYYVTIGTPTSEMYQKIEVANNRLLSGQKIMPDAIREFNLKDESGTITLPEKTSRVTITIPYADTGDGDIKIDGVRVREDTLRIYRLQNGKWEMVQGEQTQNPAENWICAGVNAFSVFALIGEAYPSDFSQLLVYPNPFKPGSGEKVNFQGLMDNATIRIYNLAGELAWEKQGIVDGKTTWDGKNNEGDLVASGTYIYIITDVNGHKKTGKVAVIW